MNYRNFCFEMRNFEGTDVDEAFGDHTFPRNPVPIVPSFQELLRNFHEKFANGLSNRS